jgi:predicted 3-demethylubiquinone-9 3-methyltransferase (glyoxalase superfamily)
MTALRKITPHIWFDKEAVEAANLYASIFPNSRVGDVNTLHDTPSGDSDIIAFELMGQPFQAISAGPYFRPNPSISFSATFTNVTDVDAAWARLADGGQVLMPLDAYPFNAHYGWVQDRFGVSWQLAVASPLMANAPTLTPSLLFIGDNFGKAAEAIHFYTALFANAQVGQILRNEHDPAPEHRSTIMFADFVLADQRFTISENSYAHEFAFNEAISFMVKCDSQEEIDHLWRQLSADPTAEQCGWLKDKYGLSWQITPAALDAMLRDGSPAQIERVTQAFLSMKKFDLAALQQAYADAAIES